MGGWDFRVVGFSTALLNSKPVERNICVVPRLLSETNPDNRFKLGTPLYGIFTACRELYIALWDYLVDDLWGRGGRLR